MLQHPGLQGINCLQRHGNQINVTAGKGAIAKRFIIAALSVGALSMPDQIQQRPVTAPMTHRRIDDAMRSRGIDVGAVRDALDIHLEEIDALLQHNREQARLLSLRGTPSFLIGAKLYRAALTPGQIREAIQQVRQGRS